LATNPNFATSMERVKNREELLGELSAIIATNTRSVWLAKMRHSGVPAGPINTLAEALGSPELRDRGLITEIMHPALGSVPNIALPIKLADTPLVSASAAPLLGQHSEQVLHEVLGYDQQRIDDLIRSGAVART
jgi:crotonobetainyl-CoA:carnitine CoA-transferase CaiB-like acyl-CoA transferase